MRTCPVSIAQPEQPPRIVAADLSPIVLTDRAAIEPNRGVVDALLDAYNVGRLCSLIDEMTRSTGIRFIIITNNSITMRA